MRILQPEFILFVADPQRSKRFYAALLDSAPLLDVPGMIEFDLGGAKLGLMANDNIARIISPPLAHPGSGGGAPRCELYLLIDDLPLAMERAERAGALVVDPLMNRDWGHRAAYFADPDGHVIALAEPLDQHT
jgi:predicted enzyme related to lactoylglutathione lyase